VCESEITEAIGADPHPAKVCPIFVIVPTVGKVIGVDAVVYESDNLLGAPEAPLASYVTAYVSGVHLAQKLMLLVPTVYGSPDWYSTSVSVELYPQPMKEYPVRARLPVFPKMGAV
jgi:hypothetical protein